MKASKNSIAKALKMIFTRSLELSEIPRDWKLANVVPIYKKGKRSLPENYRPVSLTSIVGKLLEGIIRNKVIDFIEAEGLIGDSQHGFRNRKFCLTNLLRIL